MTCFYYHMTRVLILHVYSRIMQAHCLVTVTIPISTINHFVLDMFEWIVRLEVRFAGARDDITKINPINQYVQMSLYSVQTHPLATSHTSQSSHAGGGRFFAGQSSLGNSLVACLLCPPRQQPGVLRGLCSRLLPPLPL